MLLASFASAIAPSAPPTPFEDMASNINNAFWIGFIVLAYGVLSYVGFFDKKQDLTVIKPQGIGYPMQGTNFQSRIEEVQRNPLRPRHENRLIKMQGIPNPIPAPEGTIFPEVPDAVLAGNPRLMHFEFMGDANGQIDPILANAKSHYTGNDLQQAKQSEYLALKMAYANKSDLESEIITSKQRYHERLEEMNQLKEIMPEDPLSSLLKMKAAGGRGLDL